jgi:hypothetical protein
MLMFVPKSLGVGLLVSLLAGGPLEPLTAAYAGSLAEAVSPAVGSQYSTTHVYLNSADVDRFVASFLATFGGSSTRQVITTVTPTASSTSSQLLLTPVGSLSVFGFRSPIPYPFGQERTGYMVQDLDVAVRQARADGAGILVAPFSDPIGRDSLIQWPGGVNMQLYWHTTARSYPVLETVPENRVYVPPEKLAEFVRDFIRFSKGKVVSDDLHAPGIEIGRPGDSYHRVRITSGFGRMVVLATDGHLPYPFGRESTGYEVANVAETLTKARAADATVLVEPYTTRGRQAAMLAFPGGYIAEINAQAR